jgi:hypothetical protein
MLQREVSLLPACLWPLVIIIGEVWCLHIDNYMKSK